MAWAAARSICLDAAVSATLRRGLAAEMPTEWENGHLIFSPRDADPLTPEHVQKLIDEIEDEIPDDSNFNPPRSNRR